MSPLGSKMKSETTVYQRKISRDLYICPARIPVNNSKKYFQAHHWASLSLNKLKSFISETALRKNKQMIILGNLCRVLEVIFTV